MNTQHYTVTVLGFDQALASAITGALDLFAFAGVSWQRIHGIPAKPYFNVQLASIHGKPFQCSNQLTLTPHVAIEEVEQTHILLVPTIGGDIAGVLEHMQNQYVHIRRLHKVGADVAGNCTGAFILAESGLLKERVATTHWGYAQLFKQRYPDIHLHPDKMVTEQDAIFCAGGGMAWIDLALILIERYCGHEVASNTAKSHVLDLTRNSQSLYASARQRKFHQDKDILAIQEYIELYFHEKINFAQVASKFNLTERTLLRRFKSASDTTPLQYLQTIRIEQARKLLELSSHTIETIVNLIGYEDLSAFSRLFKRRTGLSPSQYKAKFNANRA